MVVVSANSSITEISGLHLADLYLGRAVRFENGATAMPIDQKSGSAGRGVFSETYLNRTEAQVKAHWSKIIFTGRGRPPREVANPAELKELLRSNQGAIGYIDSSQVDSTLRIVRVN